MELEETKLNNVEELLQLVSFKIENEEFGIDIFRVKEINRMMQVTKVPNAPHYVEGVVNLRGKIIPVVDIRSRLHLTKKVYDKNTRIIVVELDTSTVGFVVDEVREVLRLPVSITEQPPSIVGSIDSDFIKSVGKLDDRILILLDLEKILEAEGIQNPN
jgi:purine-binding chemotaxis protein CheW